MRLLPLRLFSISSECQCFVHLYGGGLLASPDVPLRRLRWRIERRRHRGLQMAVGLVEELGRVEVTIVIILIKD